MGDPVKEAFPIILLFACTSQSDKDSAIDAIEVDTSENSEIDTGETSIEDSAADSGETEEDSGETGEDTSDPFENCTIGLTVDLDGVVATSGELRSFPERPSLSNPVEIELTLTNSCEADLRFLGFPGDWIIGEGFELATLPPILIPPLETATMSLQFTPGQEGDYSGSLTLPYDLPGAPFILDLSATVSQPLKIVLVGDGISAVTDDYGETIHETQFTTQVHSNESRRGVCWGLDQFIATGGSDERRMWTSPDGLTWSEINQGGGWIADCAYGNGMVVSAGGFHFLTATTDGINWNMGGSFTGEHIRGVAFGNGVFVAVGGTDVSVSSDGLTWNVEMLHGAANARYIAYGNGIFVGIGDGGSIIASGDSGQSWSVTALGTDAWVSILYGNGYFYIGDGATLYRSADGIAWQLVNTTNGITPRAIVGSTLFGTNETAFQRSDDGGFSWIELAPLTYGGGFNDSVVEGELP